MYYDGDRYLPDGKVTRRYGVLTLDGTTKGVTGGGISSELYYFTRNIVNDGMASGNTGAIPNIISDKFLGMTGVTKGHCYIIGSGTIIVIVLDDQTITTNEGCNNWLASNNATFVYELAEPVIEEADPYQHLQQCDPNGTEEFVSTGIVPVGHETRYPENLRAKIEGLPWDFSSLIAPTEKTTTASRNYTAGSLLIMGNVLYKVTANIANGGTITPNTNVTATTLSEILSALAQ
jgi:hypothetical protein